MTNFVGETANRMPVDAGVFVGGEGSQMLEGSVVEAFECNVLPSVSNPQPKVAIAVIDDLDDLRNDLGGF